MADLTKFSADAEALAQLFWRWHTETDRPLVVRSHLRELAAWAYGQGVRPPAPERPLDRPAAYDLATLLRELKWGRPAASQQWLDEKIAELEGADDVLKEEG